MMNYMGTCDTVLTPTLDTQAMSLKMKTIGKKERKKERKGVVASTLTTV